MSDITNLTTIVSNAIPPHTTLVDDHTTCHQLTDNLFRVNATAVAENDDELTYYLYVFVIDQSSGHFRTVSETAVTIDALPYL